MIVDIKQEYGRVAVLVPLGICDCELGFADASESMEYNDVTAAATAGGLCISESSFSRATNRSVSTTSARLKVTEKLGNLRPIPVSYLLVFREFLSPKDTSLEEWTKIAYLLRPFQSPHEAA